MWKADYWMFGLTFSCSLPNSRACDDGVLGKGEGVGGSWRTDRIHTLGLKDWDEIE